MGKKSPGLIQMDRDEEYKKLHESILSAAGELPRDQFYRVIQNS